MNRKSIKFQIEKAIESEDRSIGTIRGLASTYSTIDSYGDQVLPGAFKKSIRSFKKNNRMIPMLSGHSMDKVIGGFDPSQMKETEDGLMVEGKIDLDTQRGREDFSLMKKGFMTGMSIGGMISPEDVEMTSKGVRQIKNFELMEISVTPMPANQDAQVTEVKGATSFKDYPLMDEGTEWDKSKAISDIRAKTKSEDGPSGTYRNGFMWFDSDDSESFGAYKLPFTYVVDGEFKAVPRAIFAIAAVLNGARGGVDIPASDIAKVKSNVEKYYKKMGRDSPFTTSNDKSLKKDKECDTVVKATELDVKMTMMKLNNLIRRIKN